MTKYLFRIDDVADRMPNWNNFKRLCNLFRQHNIKPIIAVIPDNQDPEIDGKKRNWIKLVKGFTIAQHGYQHLKTGDGGIRKLNPYGEFGGLSYLKQKEMIKKGKIILKKKYGLKTDVFVPPWHSYDMITLLALKVCNFKFLSDGTGIYPYYLCVEHIPVNDWKISKKLLGYRTLTMHVQDITLRKIKQIKQFIIENKKDIISIDFFKINILFNALQEIIFKKRSFPINYFYIIYFWFRYAYKSPLIVFLRMMKSNHTRY